MGTSGRERENVMNISDDFSIVLKSGHLIKKTLASKLTHNILFGYVS